ncbi:hypothetical protein R5M92_11495 [Halomonas sp. Bachu 37]|uniref:hypothetical protein n=1 Tax=Halomonas kashgarensis TaxID=3084920 RepID=UPI0032163BCC
MGTTRRVADMKRQKRGWVYSTCIIALTVGTLTLTGCGDDEEPPEVDTPPEEYEPTEPLERESEMTDDESDLQMEQEPMVNENENDAEVGVGEEPLNRMPEQDGDESGFVEDESGFGEETDPMPTDDDEELN